MKDLLINLSTKWAILKSEDGQDLVEYALVLSLIAVGTSVAIKTLSGDISTVFTDIGTILANAKA